MSCLTVFPAIDPREVHVLSFKFANGMPPTDSIVSPIVEITGPGDAAPSTRFSSPQVQGQIVLVTAYGCQPDVLYHLRVIAPTTDPENTLVIGADLECKYF